MLNRTSCFMSGLGMGLGLLYLLDPESGRRRRVQMRDRGARLAHRSQDFFGRAGRDLASRTRGAVSGVRDRFRPSEMTDDRLHERVRAKMGRHVSYPHAIEMSVNDGVVRLAGPIFDDEVTDLVIAIEALPGVEGIENRLEPHLRGENIPALRGNPMADDFPGAIPAFRSPGVQLLAGAAAAAVVAFGIVRIARGRMSQFDPMLDDEEMTAPEVAVRT